jgi:hypothetical protein
MKASFVIICTALTLKGFPPHSTSDLCPICDRSTSLECLIECSRVQYDSVVKCRHEGIYGLISI